MPTVELVHVTNRRCEVLLMRDEAQARRVAKSLARGEVFLAVDGLVTHWYRRLISDRPAWQPIEVDTITDDYAWAVRHAAEPVDPWTVAAVAVHRITCYECEKQFRSFEIEESGTGLCDPCYELAGIFNAHTDGLHDTEPDPSCPECAERS